MLKIISASAVLGLLAAAAPLPGSEAQAARESYRQCVNFVFTSCQIMGPMGPIYPEAGTPEYEAQQQCMESGLAYCATLPDAP